MKIALQAWVFLGASGRVGRLVTRSLRAAPIPALPITYQIRTAAEGGSAFVWAPLDGPAGLLTHVQRAGRVQGMFVFLGATPGQASDMGLNVSLAEACLNAAAQAEITRVLLASSSAVYGAGRGLAFTETDPLQPVNNYGLAKARMEDACQPWRARGLEVCCLRIGNVAGADALLKHIGTQEPRAIEQFADGLGPQRSYIGPATLGDVLVSLARHTGPLPPSINIATPDPVRMADLATAADMPWGYTPATSAPALQNITINCRLLETLHSFAPDDKGPDAIVRQLQEAI